MKQFSHFSIFSMIVICLAGCSKPIHGKLTDNFGIPISDAEIKIKDSGFMARTNGDGYFDLDYAPGKMEISFSKMGYVSQSKTLEISQKSDYPLGDIQLIRLPNRAGIFVMDSLDYKPLQKVKINKVTKVVKSIMLGRQMITTYSIQTDSLKISKKKKGEITVYQYRAFPYHLLTPINNNVLLVEDMFGCAPQAWINDNQIKATDELMLRTFTPESNRIYAYTFGIKKQRLITTLSNLQDSVYAIRW